MADSEVEAYRHARTFDLDSVISLVLVLGFALLIFCHGLVIISGLVLVLVADGACETTGIIAQFLTYLFKFGVEFLKNVVDAAVKRGVNGYVKLEVLFLRIILIDHIDLAVDHAAHTFDSTFENKGAEVLCLPVVDNCKVEISLQRHLVHSAYAHAGDDADDALLRFRMQFVLNIIGAVEIESSMNVVH